MTYKTAFDLSRDLVDAAIRINGRETVRRALQEALDTALRSLSETPVSEVITAGLRVVFADGGAYVVWSDITRLCKISNPSYYYQSEKRSLRVRGRSAPLLALPVPLAFDFLMRHGKREVAFALADAHIPKIADDGISDELAEAVSVDDRSNPT